MLPTTNELTARVKISVAEMKSFIRDEFKLPDFNPMTQLKREGRSLGGWSASRGWFIKLCVGDLLTYPVVAFTEYKSYNWRTGVGGFKTDDWRVFLDALIAHELAHVVQYQLIKAPSTHPLRRPGVSSTGYPYFEGLGQSEGNHSAFFLAIYRKLRERFVNDRVPSSAYTDPRKRFMREGDGVETKHSDHPLIGKTFLMNGKLFTVTGKSNNTRRQYGYIAKTGAKEYGVKLLDMYRASKEIQEIVDGNITLRRELEAMKAKAMSRARAQATRNARGAWRWAA